MEIQKTQYFSPAAVRPASILILDRDQTPKQITMKGNMTFGRNYPESDCDIRVESQITGRDHGEFVYNMQDDSYSYVDHNSANGSYVNGMLLGKDAPGNGTGVKLSDGDIIRVDRRTLNNPHPEAVLMIFSRSFASDENWNYFQMDFSQPITIGRGETNRIRINDLMASREHAEIRQTNKGVVLYDKKSQNGIGVNGYEIKGRTNIYDHDVIKIGNTTFIIIGSLLIYNNSHSQSGYLSVNIEQKTVNFGKKTLLRDIRFDVDRGDFVLILGGSGAGKTTLVKAILGDGGKTDGKVILDGQNLYANFKSMKSRIGLVPQFLTLRTGDTVWATLMDVADIKLDRKYFSKSDKKQRVEEIINRVGVDSLKNSLIKNLSGGQKKKVSVAAQLIGFQQVFVCDEPDSGLDAASRIQQMEILKEISLNGKIVMVISHEPDDAIDMRTREILFTKVLVLAKSSRDKSGHLAYFGDVKEALEFFHVEKLQDIMLEINPDYEGGRGRGDYYISKFSALRGGAV